jgi:thiosulfate/3-mercaptopyruvate sulfurtransferase
MTYANPDALVSTEWLAAHLEAPDVRVVDASQSLPTEDRDARAAYEARHIPGAVFFDIDEIADSENPLPHMLPSPEKFASLVSRLGLGDGHRIIIYDSAGLYSAGRAWWMFRVFGHDDIAVLDGGLPKWLREGRPTESGKPMPGERKFTSSMNTLIVRDLEHMKENLESRREQVLDSRPAGRFAGTEPEPRPGLRSGHIPGSRNLPYTDILDPDTGTLRPADELHARVTEAGIDLDKPVITTCGTGVTAAGLALALYLLGHSDVAVYDGSWTEWGGRDDTPVET